MYYTSLISDNNTNFYGAITCDEYLVSFLESKIEPENMPIWIESKEGLIKELKKKKYAENKLINLLANQNSLNILVSQRNAAWSKILPPMVPIFFFF